MVLWILQFAGGANFNKNVSELSKDLPVNLSPQLNPFCKKTEMATNGRDLFVSKHQANDGVEELSQVNVGTMDLSQASVGVKELSQVNILNSHFFERKKT